MQRSPWWLPTLLASCAACGGPFAAVDRSALPPASDYPDQDAVVLERSLAIRFAPGDKGPVVRETTRTRVLVLDPKGSEHADLGAFYDRTFSRLVDARARVVRPDGDTKSFGLDDMADQPSVFNALYSDNRVVSKSFGALPAGTVVDWITEVEWNNPTWVVNRFYFGSRVPTRRATYEVFVPDGWDVDHTAKERWQTVQWPPQRTPVEGGTRLVWERTDIPALEREPYAPTLSDLVPIVYVRLAEWVEGGQRKRSFGTFEDYARWMHGVQEGTAEPSPELEAVVKDILRDLPDDPETRARKLYEWVQEQIRYVSVQIGMGGWRPTEAKEVFRLGYGDCKDKANLLRTMLRVAGIDSSLVSLYSHDGVPRPFVLPGVGNTNHAIIAVHLPDRTVLADPTERTVPFGFLPPRDQGAQVLLIDAERPELKVTPASRAEDNVKVLRIELDLPKSGVSAKGHAALETTGPFAWDLRRAVVTGKKSDEDDLFEGWSWLENDDAKNVRFSIEDPNRVTAKADVSVGAVGTEAGARLLLRPDAVLRTPGADLVGKARRSPVVFRTEVTRDTELRFRLGGARVGALPEPTRVESDLGRFEQAWSVEEDTLVIRSLFVRTARYVPPERYAELSAFLGEVVEARSRQVIVYRGEERR